ncbi:MAG: peptidylprolyl isomerase [Nitrospinae bacterium]|nr:peptidylprolyl isomerase [Nitrospinota bacterium]
MAVRFLVAILVLALIGGSLFLSFGGLAGNNAPEAVQQAQGESAPKPAFTLDGQQAGAQTVKQEPVKIDYAAIPDVIAEVGGVKVKKDVLVRALQGLEKTFAMTGQSLTKDKLDGIRNTIVDNIINNESLYQKAEKDGVQVDSAKVEESLAHIKGQFKEEGAFKKMLQEQGMTEDDARREITRGLRIRAMLDKNVLSAVKVTPEEVKKYYDVNQMEFERKEMARASHILAKFDGADQASKDKAKKKIESIEKKLKDGADFAKLAMAESDDPGTAKNGGQLGFFSRGMMVPEFEKAAFDTQAGKLSAVVETKFGYHIIKVDEKRPAGVVSFEEAKAPIESKLKNQQATVKVQEFIKELKKSMNVKKFI